jgi:FkbM family methyltransferase
MVKHDMVTGTDAVEPVADPSMDAKMREIWARLEKPWVRKILQQSLPPTPITSMGCAFIVHPRDNFTEFRMWENGLPPEHEATMHLADRLADSGAVIVDVGANAGAFSLPIIKRAGAGARALLVEPNPVMRARLAVNLDLNGLVPTDAGGARVLDCAISDAAGQARLHFPGNGNLGQGRIGQGYAGPNARQGVEVALRPLADCLAEAGFDRVDLLKVDVEGLEDRVIAPLLQAEAAPRPALIYVEIEHQATWTYPLLDVLAAAGYAEERAFGKNRLFRHEQ